MIDFIQSETKKIMYNCIKKYAEREKKDISSVQLVLGLDENGNTYTLCVKSTSLNKSLIFLVCLG